MSRARPRPPRSGFLVAGAAIVVALVLVGLLAPLLAPYDPLAFSGDSLEPPSPAHPLGTDDLGQDILSGLIWGARSSLIVAVGAATLALALGVLLGAGAGLLGGAADAAVMRLVDVWLALPVLPLLMLVAAFAGRSRLVVVVVLGLLAWPVNARILRAQTLSLRARGFVEAAHGFGSGALYVLRRHLVPALGPLLVVGFVQVAAMAVVAEAGLAFLGLGDPEGVSWGATLNRAVGYQGIYLADLWTWWLLPAGLAITLAVLGITFLGVGIEPRLNPRWRRS